MSRRPLCTKPGSRQRVHDAAGCSGGARGRSASRRPLRVRRPDEVEQVRTLGLIELESAAHAIEHVIGDAARVAALEPRVVLGADAGEQGDLLAPKACDPAMSTVGRQARALGRELRPPRGQKFADLFWVTHRGHRTPIQGGLGGTPSTPIARAFLAVMGRWLDGADMTNDEHRPEGALMPDRKVWFITGAGRGLGADIARAALGAGNAVIATGRDPGRSSDGARRCRGTSSSSRSTSRSPSRPMPPSGRRGSLRPHRCSRQQCRQLLCRVFRGTLAAADGSAARDQPGRSHERDPCILARNAKAESGPHHLDLIDRRPRRL